MTRNATARWGWTGRSRGGLDLVSPQEASNHGPTPATKDGSQEFPLGPGPLHPLNLIRRSKALKHWPNFHRAVACGGAFCCPVHGLLFSRDLDDEVAAQLGRR